MDNILTDILDIQDKILDISCSNKINQEEFGYLAKIKNDLENIYNIISNRQQEEIK